MIKENMYKISIPCSTFLTRFFHEIFTFSGILFFLFTITSIFLFEIHLSLTIFFFFMLFLFSSFFQSIKCIYSIKFENNEMTLNYLFFDKNKSFILNLSENIEIEDIDNPVGITSLLGNYFIIKNEVFKFKQFKIEGWNNPMYLKELKDKIVQHAH